MTPPLRQVAVEPLGPESGGDAGAEALVHRGFSEDVANLALKGAALPLRALLQRCHDDVFQPTHQQSRHASGYQPPCVPHAPRAAARGRIAATPARISAAPASVSAGSRSDRNTAPSSTAMGTSAIPIISIEDASIRCSSQ